MKTWNAIEIAPSATSACLSATCAREELATAGKKPLDGNQLLCVSLAAARRATGLRDAEPAWATPAPSARRPCCASSTARLWPKNSPCGRVEEPQQRLAATLMTRTPGKSAVA
jgi:hypothetical protein